MTPERREHLARSQQRAVGQATIELALVLSFLALLLVGIADVARIYTEHLAVVHAAAVGARWATLDPNYKACSGYTGIGTPVVEDLASSVPAANIINIQSSPSSNPDAVRVDITYRHDFLFGLVNNVPGQFTAGATMPGTISGLGGTCPTPPPTPTPTATRTGTPVPTPTPQICPLRFSDHRIVKQVNGMSYIWVSVTLVDAQNRPFSGANVSASVNDNPGDNFTLNETFAGSGVYARCSNIRHNGTPSVTVTAIGGGCNTVVQTWNSQTGGTCQ